MVRHYDENNNGNQALSFAFVCVCVFLFVVDVFFFQDFMNDYHNYGFRSNVVGDCIIII
jgi:hypothetical protein